MPWPLSQDYNEAIQTPTQCFADPELKRGEVVTNALGLPHPCSGNFADVYAITAGPKKWAVKCFTRQIPGLRERYAEVSKYLQQFQLPFMVEFRFLEEGIQVRGQWYPVLKMDWVEGMPLNAFLKEYSGVPQVLEAISQIWVRLAAGLREANLAHGDLQHGNILLVQGTTNTAVGVRLVDYDGMCVPALTELKSIEVGHASYQHPQRLREGLYGLEIDRFSHLVIYTALRSLMVGGRALWEKYDDGDNLLFTQRDFEYPSKSPLFADLLKLKDPMVGTLVRTLIDASRKSLDQVPLLDQLVGVPKPQPTTGLKTQAPVRDVASTRPPAGRTEIRPPVQVRGTTAPPGGATDAFATPVVSAQRKPYQSKQNHVLVMVVVASAALVGLVAGGMVLYAGLRSGQRTEPEPVLVQGGSESDHLGTKTTALRPANRPTSPSNIPTTSRDPKLKPSPDFGKETNPEPGPVLGPNDLPAGTRDLLVGTWDVRVGPTFKSRWTFRNDGMVSSTNGVATGSWKYEKDRHRVIITWRDPNTGKDLAAWDSLKFPLDPTRTFGDTWQNPDWRVEAVKLNPEQTVTRPEEKSTPPTLRTPVPDDMAQAKAEKLIKDLFKVDYAKKKPTEMLAFAEKLMQQAAQTQNDPVARFVLLREARDLAAQAGEAHQALTAVEVMAKEYAIDPYTEKISALEKVGRGFWTVASKKKLVEVVLMLLQEVVASDNFEAAPRLLRMAEIAAQNSKDASLLSAIERRGKAVMEMMKEFEQVKKAAVVLSKDAKDPDANLVMGRYICFYKGEWDKGLPMLTMTNDEKLKDLAKKDLARPTNATEQAVVGDGWWNLAEADKGSAKEQLQRRSYHWYNQAAAGLTGLDKTKVDQRIADLEKTLFGHQLTILLARYGAHNTWHDVTSKVQKLVKGSKLSFKPEDIYTGDPVPGKHKSMIVVYRIDGKSYLTIRGNSAQEPFTVPASAGSFSTEVTVDQPGLQLVIVKALWGADTEWTDVTPRLPPVKAFKLVVNAEKDLNKPDPSPNKAKTLVILYKYLGNLHLDTKGGGAVTTLPAP